MKIGSLGFPYDGADESRSDSICECDYFLDALGDPDLALKISKRQPETA